MSCIYLFKLYVCCCLFLLGCSRYEMCNKIKISILDKKLFLEFRRYSRLSTNGIPSSSGVKMSLGNMLNLILSPKGCVIRV